MACGGFTCSKNALCSLNVVYMETMDNLMDWPALGLACLYTGYKSRVLLYILVGLLLIGVAVWGKGFGIVFSIHIIGGVIAVGVFLLLIAIVGLIGALNHHQVMLFFYMVILLLVFLFQFGVSCSCLAMNRSQQVALLNATWRILLNETKGKLEKNLNCCGLLNTTADCQQFLSDIHSCSAPCRYTACQTCGDKMLQHSAEALKILGGVGLFFSFTEILGVWLAARYRNQKDPRANPSAFL